MIQKWKLTTCKSAFASFKCTLELFFNVFFEFRAKKIINMRLFDDDQEKRWAKSVKDKNLEVLCVSQVKRTKYASYRISYHDSFLD